LRQHISAPHQDGFSLLGHRLVDLSWPKVRRNTKLIVGIVVVGVAVVVNNAEIVGIARIRTRLPPVNSKF
jgi:hypothetical protein